ncbi:MAG: glycosyltransferase [Pirellulales bacterium]|nr:glycosyltransferase [Pirellulales bacterium]
MDVWWLAYLLLSACGVIQALLFALYAFEARRFAASRRAKPRGDETVGRVMVFAPCKGIDAGQLENQRRLFEQDYPDYELTFIVEDACDPAVDVIERLRRAYPRVASRLVVAGQATDTGQKVHNLIAATGDLPEQIKVLAFVDADARPSPHWLGDLVQRLSKPETVAVTGYRWFVPERWTLPNLLLSSMNTAVAGLFGPGGFFLLWGGSWSIRRESFAQADIRRSWQGTLSDDLVASRVLRAASAPIEFEPKCIVATPLDSTWPRLIEFVRRQHTIGRCYSPFLWWGTLFFGGLANLTLIANLALTGYGTMIAAPWTWLPLAILAVLWTLGAFRAHLRHDLAKACTDEMPAGALARLRRFDYLWSPLVGCFNWLLLVSTIASRTITWRGNTYYMARGGSTRLISRATLPTAPFASHIPAPHHLRLAAADKPDSPSTSEERTPHADRSLGHS